ncbi:MAG TPA: site-specific integrase [Vicinamibacterales bacterium]|nr:site-specific integrase [Vicinamibacterales bacterium]
MRTATSDGLRKICGCARRSWAKCPHPWYFDFKWNGERYRFSLDRRVGRLVKDATGKWRRDRASLGDRITNKTEAADERDRLRAEIRKGTIQEPAASDKPQRETLTLEQLMSTYRKHYVQINRLRTLKNTEYQANLILRTELQRLDGTLRPFGQWLVADITADTIEQFQRVRLARGIAAANRDLSLLRAMFSWAVRRDHLDRTPFKKGTEVVVRLSKETQRHRRLQAGEAERLLEACGPRLRPLVEAAIESGCRKGELLSLQWHQVRFEPRAEIFLPAGKTKTKADRTVPMSSRLKAILEMRRHAPDGTEHPSTAYVFGNEVGEQAKSFKRAWERAVLVAHGHRPAYVAKRAGEAGKAVRTAVLTPECRAVLRAIDLHFHDLRREAGSRWLDAGVPLHRIQKWLGHANISQTSTYLMADSTDDDDAMRRFEERRANLPPIATDSQTGAETGQQGQTITNATSAKQAQTRH